MDSRYRPGGARGGQRDVLTRPARAPDLLVRYGKHADQVADVHLPGPAAARRTATSAGPICAIFFHGGFWRAAYGREHTAPLAEALAAAGFVVCAPEYRRVGQGGGGWPGTFDDVAAAADALPRLVAEATGGLAGGGRVVLGGHSAGGHLALWAAARHRLPPGTPWHSAKPDVAGVVALASVSDLTACFELKLGRGAAAALIGGKPKKLAERYAVADPSLLLPVDVPVRLVHGADDNVVPCQMSRSYAEHARDAGDDATCTILPGCGHFDVIDPLSPAWPQVLDAFSLAAESGRPGGTTES